MQAGDRYVVNSQNTLYYLPSASCNEGSSVSLNNTQYVSVYNINGAWLKGSTGTTGNYSNNNYICHVWTEQSGLNPNYLILPAVAIVLCLFSVIFHWFLRLRG